MSTLGESIGEIWNGLSPGLTVASYTTSFVLVGVTILWLLPSLSSYFQANVQGRLPLPPGNLGLPLIGESLEFFVASQGAVTYREWIMKRAKKYGPFFKTHLFGVPTVVMEAPAGNKFLFQNEGKLVQNELPGPLRQLLGPASLTMKIGEEYKISRQHLGAFFDHAAVFRYLAGLDKDIIQHFAKDWEGKDELSALEMTKKCTFDTICTLLIALTKGQTMDAMHANFGIWARAISKLPINLPGFGFRDSVKARNYILGLLDGIIRQRRQELAEGRVSESVKVDVLTSLLTIPDENGRFLGDAELKDNVLLFLFAGYDTTSATLAIAMYYIAKHPHVYEQLVQEHQAIVKRKRERGESNALTPEDLSAMKYTWMVLKETLRLQPPVPGSFRKAISDIEYNGRRIPKGWKLMWNSQQSHYDPKYFQDPLTFNPSRWETPPLPFTFLPFGGGPRTCPGYEFAKVEMLAFLHHLVRGYQWTLVDPGEPIMRDPFPTTRKNVPIRIRKIESF